MAYIGNSPGVASQRIVTTFTATSGQTTFTPQSGYTVGYLDVFLNGVKLVNGDDYTASNGTTLVLASPAAAGDSIEAVAFLPRGLSDGYLKAEADSKFVDVTGDTMTGPLVLPGNPSSNLQAAPKQYVDSAVAAVDLSTRVAKSGDTMTGTLSIGDNASIYVPHTGATGGTSNSTVREIKWGNYGRIQHTSFNNVPLISFNARLIQSDFPGSSTGGTSNLNVFAPDYSPGTYGIISSVNGGVSFNTGPWGGNSSLNLSDLSTHSSYAGGVTQQGYWVAPKQPAFQARKTSGANTQPLTPIIFDSEIFDNGGNYNPANGRFTVPVEGVYQFNFSTILFTVTNYSYAWFTVNGASTQVSTHSPVTDADYQSHSLSVTLKLAAGDYVEVYFGANGGSPSIENSRTFFSGFLVG
jgi:hypothetical protein